MLSVAACMPLHSCDLLTPDDIINPNVSDDTFLGSANAMQAWVNGTNRSFAEAMGNYCLLMEILSDNYFNNYCWCCSSCNEHYYGKYGYRNYNSHR